MCKNSLSALHMFLLLNHQLPPNWTPRLGDIFTLGLCSTDCRCIIMFRWMTVESNCRRTVVADCFGGEWLSCYFWNDLLWLYTQPSGTHVQPNWLNYPTTLIRCPSLPNNNSTHSPLHLFTVSISSPPTNMLRDIHLNKCNLPIA